MDWNSTSQFVEKKNLSQILKAYKYTDTKSLLSTRPFKLTLKTSFNSRMIITQVQFLVIMRTWRFIKTRI